VAFLLFCRDVDQLALVSGFRYGTANPQGVTVMPTDSSMAAPAKSGRTDRSIVMAGTPFRDTATGGRVSRHDRVTLVPDPLVAGDVSRGAAPSFGQPISAVSALPEQLVG